MRRLLPALSLALALVAGAVPAWAGTPDDTDPTILSALGSVPDTSDVRQQIVSWVDYRAVEAARPGAAQPTSLAELQALMDADDPAGALWMAAFMGLQSGSGDLVRYLFASGHDWPRVVGFDFFDVDRELAFGAPPADGIVLEGRFDPAVIGATLGARQFTSTPAGEATLWCGPDGCDEGLMVDVAGRDVADPFGGDLGRKQPLAVSEAALSSSAAIETVQGMLDARADDIPSLADDPLWVATATALAGEGMPIQATFVPATELGWDPARFLGENLTEEELRARLAELAEGFEPIAPALLLGIGDGATESEQVVTLALAYATLEDAELAADVLPRRLETMDSVRTGQPLRELLADRGVTSVEGRAEPIEAGGALTILTLRAPLAGDEPEPGSDRFEASSMLYRLFIQMIFSRDVDWLTPTLPTLES